MGAPEVIAFRTTAGKGIGFGHLRRCLTLAGELAARGVEPRFWIDSPPARDASSSSDGARDASSSSDGDRDASSSSDGAGDGSGSSDRDGDTAALDVARAEGYAARRVVGVEPQATLALVSNERPAALVADSYALDGAWFAALRGRTRALLVVDDLADRPLDCDLVLNAAVGAEDLPYRVSAGCELLLGPTYALLRKGLAAVAAGRGGAIEPVRRVLVTLGGADPDNRTLAVVRALVESPLFDPTVDRALDGALDRSLVAQRRLDVVLGPLHGPAPELEALAEARPHTIVLHRAPPSLTALMASADLCVSAGGQTTFELAAAGLPSVALLLADNQRIILEGFARAGSLLVAGDAHDAATLPRLVSALVELASDGELRQRMSLAGRALVDGGGAARVAEALCRRAA